MLMGVVSSTGECVWTTESGVLLYLSRNPSGEQWLHKRISLTPFTQYEHSSKA